MAHDLREICVDPEPPSAHYELQGTIGEGSFGKVVLAEHLLTKTKVAVKILKERVSDSRHRSLLNEVYCMAALHHPNIVRLFHVVSSEDSLFLVMELVLGGDLLCYLGAHGRMSEDVARGVFRQLVSAIQYCHTKGIAHRDLKPQNVLLDARMTSKLADFGLGESSNIHQLSTFCGSPLYAAPELFQSPMFSGRAADNWSLGVLLYEMLTNTVSFLAKTWAGVKGKVVRGWYVIPPFLSTEVERFLEKLLTLVPAHRENLETLMPHPWLNRDQDQELQPYVEPTADAMDPGVMEQMVTMGIHWEDMKETLSPGVYDNNIVATYRMLQTEKAKPCHRIIKVRPYRPPDFQSRSPSPVREVQPEGSGFQKAEQQQTVHEVGQMAQGSAGLKAIVEDKTTVAATKATTSPSGTESTNSTCEATWGSSNAASDPSTLEHTWGSGPPTPKRCRGSGPTAPEPTTPKHLLSSITSTAKHSRGSRSATSEDSRGSRTPAPECRRSSRTTTAEPSTTEHRPGSRNITPEHRPGCRNNTAEHAPGSMNTTPEHRPGSMNTTPEHRPGCRNNTAEHRPGSMNTTPEHRPGSRNITAEHRPGCRNITPEHRPGCRNITAEHRPGCRNITPEHRPGCRNITAEHRPGSMNTTPEHRPGSMNTTPEHRPGCRNTTPEHRPGSRNTTPEHRPGSRNITAEHRPGCRNITPEHRPGCRNITAEHRPGSMNTTPEHRPGSMNTTPEHRPGCRNTTPEHRPGSRNIIAEPSALKPSWGSQNAAPAVSRGSRTDIAGQRPASRAATPQLGPGSCTTTISQASQCHPGDSLCSHFSSLSGMSQAVKQGRWRVARRCWHFFRKLCCLPPKKGHCQHRQVKPL